LDFPVAQVLAVHAGRALLSVDGNAACPRCAAGKGCGAGLLSGATRKREVEVAIGNDLQLAEGDQVLLSIPSAGLLRAAACAYGLPLAGTVLALALARLVQGPLPDSVAVGVAAAGLIAGWLGGRRLLRGSPCPEDFEPEIVERLEPSA
jgi:sigma-E factor negative regulatory protein RseC